MLEILKVKGGNNYKDPHIEKHILERLGQLLTEVKVSDQLVVDIVIFLNEGIVDDENVGISGTQVE